MNRLGRVAFYVALPLLGLYMRSSQRTRVLVWHHGRVLVVKNWLGDDRWKLPGGGVHRRETAVQGAVRELQEETGLAAQTVPVFMACEWYADGVIRFRCHYFSLKLLKQPLIKLQRGEITASAWLRPDELTPQNAAKEVLRALELHAAS